jgi:hypothetical protein
MESGGSTLKRIEIRTKRNQNNPLYNIDPSDYR